MSIIRLESAMLAAPMLADASLAPAAARTIPFVGDGVPFSAHSPVPTAPIWSPV